MTLERGSPPTASPPDSIVMRPSPPSISPSAFSPTDLGLPGIGGTESTRPHLAFFSLSLCASSLRSDVLNHEPRDSPDAPPVGLQQAPSPVAGPQVRRPVHLRALLTRRYRFGCL